MVRVGMNSKLLLVSSLTTIAVLGIFAFFSISNDDVSKNNVDDSVGGKLVISVPRDLVDAKLGGSGKDDVFFVLIDGREYAYGEISDENERTLTILFPRGAHDIEIIGTILI